MLDTLDTRMGAIERSTTSLFKVSRNNFPQFHRSSPSCIKCYMTFWQLSHAYMFCSYLEETCLGLHKRRYIYSYFLNCELFQLFPKCSVMQLYVNGITKILCDASFYKKTYYDAMSHLYRTMDSAASFRRHVCTALKFICITSTQTGTWIQKQVSGKLLPAYSANLLIR